MMARVLTEAEKFAIRLVCGPADAEPLPVYSLGREARLRREQAAAASGESERDAAVQ